MAAHGARCGNGSRRRGSSRAGQLLLPPSRSPRCGSSSLLPAPPGASPPPSATLRRPLVPALPARVARASSGKLPSTRARASSGELLSRRLPPASARRSPPQAPSVASAEAEAYTEPELVLLEALLDVQGRGSAVAPRQLQARDSRFTRPLPSAPRAC